VESDRKVLFVGNRQVFRHVEAAPRRMGRPWEWDQPVGAAPLGKWYTCRMPTTRPRYQITETEAVAEALDAAALRWPEDAENRPKLLLRLINEAHLAITDQRDEEARLRSDAIRAAAGMLTGTYPAGYLEELRKDWER
jgi:hypothetical protein